MRQPMIFVLAVMIWQGMNGQPLPNDFTWKHSATLPAAFDLREKDRLTAVRTQPAGGCWASAAISSVESFRKTAGFDDRPLSERHMQLFHGFDPVRNGNGNHFMATAYFSRGDGPIYRNPKTDTVHAVGKELPFYLTEAWFLPNDPNLIKQLIRKSGSVYTMMHFRKERHDTVSNIYYAHKEGINHVVTLVGWDDNMQTRLGSGVWIAQNSLGTRFGDNGFFYVPYQDKNILQQNAVWPRWLPYDPKMRVLYYDTLGSNHSHGFGDSVCYGLVHFTAPERGMLTQIATHVNHPLTRVKAWIYSDFDTVTMQVSGLLATTREFGFNYAGYYTIDLSKNIRFEPQDNFYIMMKYTTAGDTMPLPVETIIHEYAYPALSLHKCWVNPDFGRWPETWYEAGEGTKFKSLKFNLCIRGLFISEED